MQFETFSELNSVLIWSAFGIALVMGAVANKTNFCTMGAVSDVVNMGDWGRMRAWLFAIAVSLIGVIVLESQGLVSADQAFPPYRQSNLIWAENILGGFIFGIGMTLASGCGNKTLIRIGGGNLKSVMVFLIIGVIAYFMVNPFPGSDQTLMSLLFLDWIRPMAVGLSSQQDIGSVISAENAQTVRLVVGGIIGLGLLAFIFKSAEFRGSFDNILGGLIVGVCVLAAWYVTSNLNLSFESDFDGQVSVSAREFVDPTGSHWMMAESVHPEWSTKPSMSSMSPQSYTFINPMGQTMGYAAQGAPKTLLTFGVMAVFGVILGSLLWAIISRNFRVEWFASFRDFANHFIGAVLMGFGGVLAMGCTIGQGITGVSTLAIGSILTFFAIVLGSALTMKINYYRMVYEEEASFGKALVTSLVDLKLLPSGMRKLDAI